MTNLEVFDDVEEENSVAQLSDDDAKNIRISITTPNEWSWKISLQERWFACQDVMEELQSFLKQADLLVKRAVLKAKKILREQKHWQRPVFMKTNQLLVELWLAVYHDLTLSGQQDLSQ